MPGLKRSYHIAGMEARTIAKRLRRVERSTRANRPEMQSISFTINGTIGAGALTNAVLTNITQGNSITQRRGDEIRVWRVEVRGLADTGIDHHLIQLHTTSEPTMAIFQANPGGFILDSEANSRFTEWKHYRNYSAVGGGDPIRFVQKFRGMRVKYNGTTATSGISNQICYSVVNHTATTQDLQVSIRLWFTDP